MKNNCLGIALWISLLVTGVLVLSSPARAGCPLGCNECESCDENHKCKGCAELDKCCADDGSGCKDKCNGKCCEAGNSCCSGECCAPNRCCVEDADGNLTCVEKCWDGSCPDLTSCPTCPPPPPGPPGEPGEPGGPGAPGGTDGRDGCGTGSCSTTSAGGGSSAAGGGDFELRSVYAEFSLGTREGGKSAGSLLVSAKTPSSDLATATHLYLTGRPIPPDVLEILDSGTGNLRQIKAPQVLADVEVIDQYSYKISFYDSEHWGTLNNGLYVPSSPSTPFVVWLIENPDGASAYNRLRISKQVDSSCLARYEYEYTEGSGVATWTLYQGDCSGSAIRTESKAVQTDAQTNVRTETHQVQEAGNLVYQRVDTFEPLFGTTEQDYRLTHSEVGTGTNKLVPRHRQFVGFKG